MLCAQKEELPAGLVASRLPPRAGKVKAAFALKLWTHWASGLATG